MTTQVFLTVFLCVAISAVGHTVVTTYYIYRSTGSSVLFPGLESGTVEFNDNMIHELKKIDGPEKWLAQFHGGAITHSAYTTRGHFFHQNKSFLLERLTKEDSGVYEQRVNHVTLIQVFLSVIDPVPQPMLRRQEDDNGSCLILLECLHSGRDQYNVTFFIDGETINGTVSKNSDISILLLNGTNPQHWGTYTCNVSNLIDWKLSGELLVEPQGIQEEELLFYLFVAGLGIYVAFLLTQALWSLKRLNGYITLKKCIAKARNFCSFVLESAALLTMCYYAYQFRDEWRSLIGGTLLFLFIVMVRIAWCYLVQCSLLMRCITATEEAFLVADFLFVPLLFIAEIVLIYQDDDLCGMKTKTRWKCHFYLGIVMAPIFLAVCLSRLCRKPDPTPSAQASMSGEQGQRKGHIVGTPDNDGTAEDNAEVNVGPTRRNNDSSMDNAQRRESEEEEDEEEENGAETEDLGLYYGCRDIMDDKDSIFDTENVQGDESDESMEGIPLQAQRCIE